MSTIHNINSMKGRTQQDVTHGGHPTFARPSLTVAAAFFIVFPPLLMASFIRRYSTEIPYWDEWETVPLILKLHTGGFTFMDFWSPHNEHRMVFPRLCYLLLAKCGGWSVVKEIWANFGLALLSSFLVWCLLGQSLVTRSVRLAAMVLANIFLFSADQGFNWIWGFQLQWFLVDVFVLLTVWAVTKWTGKWLGLSVGIIGAVVTTFSLASGMCLWAAIVCGMLLQRNVWSRAMMSIWSICGALSIALYAYQMPLQSHLGYVLHHFGDYLRYVFAWIGTPVAGRDDSHAAVHIGMIGLAIFFSLSIWLVREARLEANMRKIDRDMRASPLWRVCLPWMTLSLFSVLNDALMGYGRLTFGWQQALADRYTNVSNFFWIGVAICLITIVHAAYTRLASDAQLMLWLQRGRTGNGKLVGDINARKFLVVATACVMLIFTENFLHAYGDGLGNIRQLSSELNTSAPGVYDYPKVNPADLHYLYPHPSQIIARLHLLDVSHEGPFRPAVRTQYFLSHVKTGTSSVAAQN